MVSSGLSPKDYLKKPYTRILIPDDETGTFTAQILEFPGCIAQGDTPKHAYERLEKAAVSWIEAALDLGHEIPQPGIVLGYSGRIALRLPKSLHRQAAIAAEREGTSLNQFIVAAVAEKTGVSAFCERMVQRIEQLSFQRAVNAAAHILAQFKITATASASATPSLRIYQNDAYVEAITPTEVTSNAGDQEYNFLSQGGSRSPSAVRRHS